MKTTQITLMALAALAGGQFAVAQAADDAAAAATARYQSDKKLCADEATSSARMQCLRDAKAEYEKAVASARGGAALCKECGTVVHVAVEEKKGESSPVGLIAGGVAGALLGNQIGSGTGRSVATVAGAAGGAYAGKKVEEHVRTTKVWAVKVRLEDGTERSFHFDKDPGFKDGDAVKLSGKSIVRR
ncbi:MAG: glycine zipper 2TM domain-containing protein [Rhodocyclaceae bacterium]|nr:glycine zipper 2TM domain-containing protein [Rhodocyclaceae bacterium]